MDRMCCPWSEPKIIIFRNSSPIYRKNAPLCFSQKDSPTEAKSPSQTAFCSSKNESFIFQIILISSCNGEKEVFIIYVS